MSVRVLSIIAIVAAGLLMSACSPINSKFSCNATAGDSCMTIEQVDAMTRYADGARAQGGDDADRASWGLHLCSQRGDGADAAGRGGGGCVAGWFADP